MSLTGPECWRADRGAVIVTAVGEMCFYCGEQLADPAITWHGATGPIWLHIGCTVDLQLRFSREVHEFQRHTEQRFGPKP